jgi:hypothetical protein
VIESELVSLSAEISVGARSTSFDAAIGPVAVRLAGDTAPPASVRAAQAFPIDVELESQDGPILLASSRKALPFRRGETLVLTRYVPTREGALIRATPGLSSDLVPGTPLAQRWHLAAPTVAGTYDLEVRFTAYGRHSAPAPWVKLLSGLRVTRQ